MPASTHKFVSDFHITIVALHLECPTVPRSGQGNGVVNSFTVCLDGIVSTYTDIAKQVSKSCSITKTIICQFAASIEITWISMAGIFMGIMYTAYLFCSKDRSCIVVAPWILSFAYFPRSDPALNFSIYSNTGCRICTLAPRSMGAARVLGAFSRTRDMAFIFILHATNTSCKDSFQLELLPSQSANKTDFFPARNERVSGLHAAFILRDWPDLFGQPR